MGKVYYFLPHPPCAQTLYSAWYPSPFFGIRGHMPHEFKGSALLAEETLSFILSSTSNLKIFQYNFFLMGEMPDFVRPRAVTIFKVLS